MEARHMRLHLESARVPGKPGAIVVAHCGPHL